MYLPIYMCVCVCVLCTSLYILHMNRLMKIYGQTEDNGKDRVHAQTDTMMPGKSPFFKIRFQIGTLRCYGYQVSFVTTAAALLNIP